METSVLTVPGKKASDWMVETRPKEAEAWLASLPLADSSASAQQLYHALFSLNRMDVELRDRLALMELYRAPVAGVVTALQSHFTHLALPLSPRQRQLAEFLRNLYMEMAYGYKFVVRDLLAQRNPWSRRPAITTAAERAIHYLGEVLLRSYQVYVPYPAGVWREIHELYRLAEQNGAQHEPVPGTSANMSDTTSISRSYLRVVLLGLAGPYQLPQQECQHVNQYLKRWSDRATLSADLDIDSPVGHFLVDLSADLPAMLYPKDVKLKEAPYLRVLNAVELARVVHQQINQLQKGVAARKLDLGADCFDAACLDMLRRLIKFWGMAARRQFTRRARVNRYVSLCDGVNAIHFFASGAHPFVPPEDAETAAAARAARGAAADEDKETVIDLDVAIADPEPAAPPSMTAPELYRVDTWQVRDESAGGVALSRTGDGAAYVRVGDLLGIEDREAGEWRIGVARWLKSPESGEVEMGMEMLAPKVAPVAVRPAEGPAAARYVQALVLPAIPALHQPVTLLLTRDTCQPGQDLHLKDSDEPPRRVRVLKLVERTGAFDQVVFADVRRGR